MFKAWPLSPHETSTMTLKLLTAACDSRANSTLSQTKKLYCRRLHVRASSSCPESDCPWRTALCSGLVPGRGGACVKRLAQRGTGKRGTHTAGHQVLEVLRGGMGSAVSVSQSCCGLGYFAENKKNC